MRSVNSWCGLGEHECAWGEPRCDVHLLISDLSTAEAALDRVRQMRDYAEADALRQRQRAINAEKALDRVRALCLPGRASVWIADIRAAIEGES